MSGNDWMCHAFSVPFGAFGNFWLFAIFVVVESIINIFVFDVFVAVVDDCSVGEHLISLVLSSKKTLEILATVQTLLVHGCETLTAVLGMTSIVSIICYYIGKMFQWFLLSEDYDEDKSIGTVSAILFYILALQTGLTSLSPEKRFIRLCRNFCLLITALLHFLHNIVAPILMSLSAARNPSRKRHVRALCVCVFLLLAPIGLLSVLWSRHSPSTWLLAVTAFSIEVIVKVFLEIYFFFFQLSIRINHTKQNKIDDFCRCWWVWQHIHSFCWMLAVKHFGKNWMIMCIILKLSAIR